ncbi:signal peptidase complex catalytic subunit SEC11 [Calocera cornea HHB12733]|uniref:Signal peptidase complex catalytic subunit SEC11 n=1 Tax=Calocera cornea HHB12733 TaxID=1353952 RepID=A0A165I1J0_9BASI|nr:signal peptidase complex catalytic subunit SEC11 [Calocera cornea HHB12733]
MDTLKQLRRMGVRQILLQALTFAAVLASGLMMWKALGLVCNTESPIVVVLSGSMEPAFKRGDLLFLTNFPNEKFEVGDITVYKLPHQGIPIVHRVVEAHDECVLSFMQDRSSFSSTVLDQFLLTKGDNNAEDDKVLYGSQMKWLKRSNVIGRVKGFLPYVGYVTIVLNDFPQLKYALLGGLGLLALIQKE